MKTGRHPMRTRLRLFLDWGIRFEKEYVVPQQDIRQVEYANKRMLEQAIMQKYPKADDEPEVRVSHKSHKPEGKNNFYTQSRINHEKKEGTILKEDIRPMEVIPPEVMEKEDGNANA